MAICILALVNQSFDIILFKYFYKASSRLELRTSNLYAASLQWAIFDWYMEDQERQRVNKELRKVSLPRSLRIPQSHLTPSTNN